MNVVDSLIGMGCLAFALFITYVILMIGWNMGVYRRAARNNLRAQLIAVLLGWLVFALGYFVGVYVQ